MLRHVVTGVAAGGEGVGRLADGRVVPLDSNDSRKRQLAEDVMFGSGRPVLLVPETGVDVGCDNLVVAWDNGRSAARAVLDAMMAGYGETYSNVHRGLHFLANASTEAYENAREKVRRFLNAASTDEIIFTRSSTEALIGLEHREFFVGPDFTRHGGAIAEHLQCGYLPLLELACLAELQPHLSARYRETCALLERDAQGRIVMPPPDIAPSCS